METIMKLAQDLQPGDVFVFCGDKYATVKVDVYKEKHGNWIKWSDDGSYPTHVSFYEHQYNLDLSKDWILPGSSMTVGINTKKVGVKNKRLAMTSVTMVFATGLNSEEVNANIRLEPNRCKQYSAGYTHVPVIGLDPDLVVGPRLAQVGLTKSDLIVQVLKASQSPLTRPQIMKQVAVLEGKPFRETSNVSYFDKGNPRSVIARGLVKHVTGGYVAC